MWIVAYTLLDRANDLTEDHYETHETEKKARDSYAMLVANNDDLWCACVTPVLTATEPHWQDEKTISALALVDTIAKADIWTEAENGMDEDGSVTRDFQEDREAEAQDWIETARAITGYAPPEPADDEEEAEELEVHLLGPGNVDLRWNVKDESGVIARAMDLGVNLGVDANGFWVRNWPSHEDDFPSIEAAARAFVEAEEANTDDD